MPRDSTKPSRAYTKNWKECDGQFHDIARNHQVASRARDFTTAFAHWINGLTGDVKPRRQKSTMSVRNFRVVPKWRMSRNPFDLKWFRLVPAMRTWDLAEYRIYWFLTHCDSQFLSEFSFFKTDGIVRSRQSPVGISPLRTSALSSLKM